jgi:hypothetical protein
MLTEQLTMSEMSTNCAAFWSQSTVDETEWFSSLVAFALDLLIFTLLMATKYQIMYLPM